MFRSTISKGSLGESERRRGGAGKRERGLVHHWIIGKQRGWDCSTQGVETSCSPRPFIHTTWDVLDQCHWLEINFLIKLLQEQIISHSYPAEMSPVFWLTPQEVSVTLMWAEWRCHVLLGWMFAGVCSMLYVRVCRMILWWKALVVFCFKKSRFLCFLSSFCVSLSAPSLALNLGWVQPKQFA